MKYRNWCALFILVMFFPLFAAGQADSALRKKGAYLRVDPDRVQLGEIEVGKLTDAHGSILLKLYNEGVAPLILQSVAGCCGTEIKDYTRQPILPGKSGQISVYFRIEPKLQTISRVVTIKSNALNAPETKVHISGSVVKNHEKGRIVL